MAGTMTHFCVMKKYYEKQGVSVNFNNTDPNIGAGFLGATGPDIFYIGADYTHISDYHHYKNCGFFVKNLYEGGDKSALVENLAVGFLSHIATDLVIHPFVNKLVGKYQEHIIKEINIPGPVIVAGAKSLSSTFFAHNMVEFAQDYYVQTYLFKKNKDGERHSTLFTYPIKKVRDELVDLMYDAIKFTYNKDIKKNDIDNILGVFMNYSNLGLYGNKIQNIEDHVDYVLDDEYTNYQIFLEHQDDIVGIIEPTEYTTFDRLIDKSVEITELMVNKMKLGGVGDWEDILRPWNLDTGLYTEPTIKDNEIKINFKNYENIWRLREEEMYYPNSDEPKDTGIETI